jgi:hypothetical protein
LAFLQRDDLVDGQADALAGDHVDVAGEQVGLQRGGVLDQLDDDALEAGLGPPPQCGWVRGRPERRTGPG